MSEARRARPGSRVARIARHALVGAGLIAIATAVPALGQDYQDKGFYQSYAFGSPDDPSEEWLLAYAQTLPRSRLP